MDDAIQQESPYKYIRLWEEVVEKFRERFDEYYKKFVLDRPTLDEQWANYCVTPDEWLVQEPWLVDYLDIDEPDGSTVEFCQMLFENVEHHRGTVVTKSDIVETLANYGEEEDYETVSEETVREIMKRMIEHKLGSIRMDW